MAATTFREIRMQRTSEKTPNREKAGDFQSRWRNLPGLSPQEGWENWTLGTYLS